MDERTTIMGTALLALTFGALSSGCDAEGDADGVRAALAGGSHAWQVCIQGPKELECHLVTSDLSNADPDGDGLDNYAEYVAGTDPQLRDTDRDGLTDGEELSRHLSSPIDVDTDRDSQGHSQLFDGAEVEMGTSPVVADTDGDGLDDYRETIQLTVMDPRVANLPQIRHAFAAPTLVLNLETSQSETISMGLTRGMSETKGIVITQSNTVSEQLSEAIGVSTEVSAGVTPGAMPSFGASVGTQYTLTTMTGSSFTMSEEVSKELTRSVEESRELLEQHGVSASGGTMGLQVTFANEGQRAVVISDASFDVYIRNSDATESYVTTLESSGIAETHAFPAMKLSPGGGRHVRVFSNDEIALVDAQAMLSDLSRVVIRLGRFDQQEEEGMHYTDRETALYQQTASIVVDHGQRDDGGPEVEAFQVAANQQPGKGRGVSARKVLEDVLGFELDVETRVARPWYERLTRSDLRRAAGNGDVNIADTKDGDTTLRALYEEHGSASQLTAKAVELIEERLDIDLSDTGLSPDSTIDELLQAVKVRVRRPMLVGVDGKRAYAHGCRDFVWRARWMVVLTRDGERRVVSDFERLKLRPIDHLHVIRMQDGDEDGLERRIERRLGTDDTLGGYCQGLEDNGGKPYLGSQTDRYPGWDTDGDGITDFVEAISLDLMSSPTLADTDGDGLDDNREGQAGTDPRNPDTDSDGLLDGFDKKPLEFNEVRLHDLDAHTDDGELVLTGELPYVVALDRIHILRQYADDGHFEALPGLVDADLSGDDFGPAEVEETCKRNDDDEWDGCVEDGHELVYRDRPSSSGLIRYVVIGRHEMDNGDKFYFKLGAAVARKK